MSSNSQDYFTELDLYSLVATGDPVDEWLSTLALTNVDDSLTWWTAMDQSKDPLVIMALGFLSAPGMRHDLY